MDAAMDVVFVDDSFAFDGLTPRGDAMGGPQKGLVHLAEALARRGHRVCVLNNCPAARDVRGVAWRPLAGAERPAGAELLVALRHPPLLRTLPARRRVLWATAPAAALHRSEAARALAEIDEPRLLFMGARHRADWPPDDPRASVVVPGIAPPYVEAGPPAGYWPPRAVVTTHPLMGLARLVSLWRDRVEPLVKGAELHVFSASLLPGVEGKRVDERFRDIWSKVEAAAPQGVRVRRPLPDHDMAEEYRRARVHLYPGGGAEVYAATLAESQATGLPGVTRRDGAAAERIADGRSGFLVPDDEGFANCAVLCLKEEIVYRGRSRDALDMQRGPTWDEVAGVYEGFVA